MVLVSHNNTNTCDKNDTTKQFLLYITNCLFEKLTFIMNNSQTCTAVFLI